MNNTKFDVIIVGAGPAGCSCAYQLRNSNLKVALLDKAIFPRDKICGDALSADVINQFYRIDPILLEKFDGFQKKVPSNGIRFFAPNTKVLDIEFNNQKHASAAGYIAKRADFDLSWLFLERQETETSNT